jgi:hypothetical protein
MTRRSSADATIGVSCGHRVPRVPVKLEGRAGNRYWCETCSAHRMSGGSSTGERGFDFLLELRDEISSLELIVDDPGTEQGRAIVRALGAKVAGKNAGKTDGLRAMRISSAGG